MRQCGVLHASCAVTCFSRARGATTAPVDYMHCRVAAVRNPQSSTCQDVLRRYTLYSLVNSCSLGHLHTWGGRLRNQWHQEPKVLKYQGSAERAACSASTSPRAGPTPENRNADVAKEYTGVDTSHLIIINYRCWYYSCWVVSLILLPSIVCVYSARFNDCTRSRSFMSEYTFAGQHQTRQLIIYLRQAGEQRVRHRVFDGLDLDQHASRNVLLPHGDVRLRPKGSHGREGRKRRITF